MVTAGRCQRPGCDRPVNAATLACGRHWVHLPDALRERLRSAVEAHALTGDERRVGEAVAAIVDHWAAEDRSAGA